MCGLGGVRRESRLVKVASRASWSVAHCAEIPLSFQHQKARWETEALFDEVRATLCLHPGVTDKFDNASANDSGRGLAYSSRKGPRHGSLFTLHTRNTILPRYRQPKTLRARTIV